MSTPAVLGIVTAIIVVACTIGIFLSWRYPHWGMYHTTNRPAPGVTETRYLQMYGTEQDRAWAGTRRRALGIQDDDDEFLRGLLARLRDEDPNR